MHRSITIVCPAETTDALVERLKANEHVLSLTLSRGAGIQPKGDVVSVHVLNRGADEVMTAAAEAGEYGEFSVSTEESASFTHALSHDRVVMDYDEGQWEEMETALRHQARPGANFRVLCACGGAIAAAGLLTGGAAQGGYLVGASILAPVYEPVAGIALGIALRDGQVFLRAIRSTLLGYAILVLSAGLSFWLLRSVGGAEARDFLENSALAQLSEPGLRDWLVGAAASLAGGTIVAAFRRSVIAGPLVALSIVPAAAALGMALSLGRGDRAWTLMGRLALDLGLIVVAGWLVFALKRRFVHRRDPLA